LVITLACLGLAGTTVTDYGLAEAAFRLALDDVTRNDIHYIRDTMGMSAIVVLRNLLDGDEAAAQAANKRFESVYREGLGSVTPIAGARDVILALRKNGVRVCLTTGLSPAIRDAVLEALGWQAVADLTLTPEEAVGGRGLPHPDLVLTAALRVGVADVRHIAVVGDTANDLVAGWRSGASLIAGVLTGVHDRATLGAAPHTHLLESIAELPALVA
jgi:phosphoglycolate phosphatase